MNFAKFLRTPFLKNTSGGCFCLSLGRRLCGSVAETFGDGCFDIFVERRNKIKGKTWFFCYYLTIELQKLYDEVLFKNNKIKTSTKRFFVDNLKPAWLALHVIEDLIRRYSRCLCKEEMKYLLEDPLPMEKIVGNFFLLLV